MSDQVPATQASSLPALVQSALERMAKAKHVDSFAQNELLLPWMVRVGPTSDYVKKVKAAYIPEAKSGDIIDTLTLRLRSTQAVILVKFEVHYSTFEPGGGKVVKQWFLDRSAYDAASSPPGKDFGTKLDAEGNEVKETPMYYILMVDPERGTAEPACMGWGSTQAKKTKRLNTLARADMFLSQEVDGRLVQMPFTPPIYSRVFDISTVEEADDKNSWVGWKYDVGDAVLLNPIYGEMWYAKAEAFRDQIEKGHVRPAAPEMESEGASTSRRAASAPSEDPYVASTRQMDTSEIPF